MSLRRYFDNLERAIDQMKHLERKLAGDDLKALKAHSYRILNNCHEIHRYVQVFLIDRCLIF